MWWYLQYLGLPQSGVEQSQVQSKAGSLFSTRSGLVKTNPLRCWQGSRRSTASIEAGLGSTRLLATAASTDACRSARPWLGSSAWSRPVRPAHLQREVGGGARRCGRSGSFGVALGLRSFPQRWGRASPQRGQSDPGAGSLATATHRPKGRSSGLQVSP